METRSFSSRAMDCFRLDDPFGHVRSYFSSHHRHLHQEVVTWRLQPSVLLSLLSSVSTALLMVALYSGVTITWWRAALHPCGTTLARLHHLWNHGGGGGVSAAFLAGKHVNRVAVASVLLAIAHIMYPALLQRASQIKSLPLSSNITLSITQYQRFPVGLAGVVGPGYDDASVPSIGLFLQAIQDWYTSAELDTYEDPGYACNGTCQGYVPSPGLYIDDITCDQKNTSVNIRDIATNGDFVFFINFTRYDDDNGIPVLQMITKGLTDVSETCSGTIVTNNCAFKAATVNYPLTVNGSILTRTKDAFVEPIGDPYVDLGDLSTAALGSPAGPLGALQWFGEAYFLANATISYNGTTDTYQSENNGVAATQYMDTSSDIITEGVNCGFQWNDPTGTIFGAFTDVLFRAAYYDAGYDQIQNFTVIQTVDTLTYQSVYLYLIIASAILLLALLSVSTTLYGWWEIGRRVSLSPLETAKAFGAPALQQPNLPMDARTLIVHIGEKRVRYGETIVVDNEGMERPILRIQELGVGMDPITPRRTEERHF